MSSKMSGELLIYRISNGFISCSRVCYDDWFPWSAQPTDGANNGLQPTVRRLYRVLIKVHILPKVAGAGEELENEIKKETNFNRSLMPWDPLDPCRIRKSF